MLTSGLKLVVSKHVMLRRVERALGEDSLGQCVGLLFLVQVAPRETERKQFHCALLCNPQLETVSLIATEQHKA